MQNTAHYRSTWLDPTLNKNFHWKSSCGMSQIAQNFPKVSSAEPSRSVREEDGQRWMEKQHLFIYGEKTPYTEMPAQKHLGQHITTELGIFLLLCHSQAQKLQHPGRNTSNQKKKKKKEGTLYRSLNKSLAGSSNNSWTASASWHCRSKPPLRMRPQIQTSTSLTVTVEKH